MIAVLADETGDMLENPDRTIECSWSAIEKIVRKTEGGAIQTIVVTNSLLEREVIMFCKEGGRRQCWGSTRGRLNDPGYVEY
jgi:hypothetical protein